MNAPVSCTNCGSNLGPADLDKPACQYCGTAHPHVAEARQKVEALRQVFALGIVPGATPPAAPPSPWQGAQVPAPPVLPQFGAPPPPPPAASAAMIMHVAVIVIVIIAAVMVFMLSAP
ncbi:hypothetical protein OV090_41105 [Nannocystis sp. RBIL2]|uniref:hypothetical protein n=1 Tax=Nannocystis sp. RBIL2 TaxID=2996788 RepID=UPI002270FE60|nr:hypothetical protein [Nannocystis sp. RBIL2]MCY1071213.1 hypothetical protein [Nannocystis sp. RBIL2]